MLEMFTNEPGVQVYTGNFQGTGVACKHGVKYPKHVSVCLESQKYPRLAQQERLAVGLPEARREVLQPRGVQSFQ